MKVTLTHSVAAAALLLGATTAVAQTSAPTGEPPRRAIESKDTTAPGRSSTAPGQNRPEANTNAPGRSEAAPGQNRPAATTAEPGKSEAAPGQTRERTGTTEQPASRTNNQRAEPPASANPQRSGQDATREAAPGQTNERTGTTSSRTANPDDSGNVQRRSTETQPTSGTAQRSTERENADTLSTGSLNATANLSTEQRTRVTSTLVSRAEPVTSVSFSVSVGTAVPDRVRLYEVPSEIVTIVPKYRGYSYFVVREEIVIVEPRTKKIVEVIRRSGDRRPSTALTISRDKAALIKRELKSTRTVQREVTIETGVTVPEVVELQTVPTTIVTEVPELRDYRFFVKNDEIVFVEPESRRIVEVIR